MKKLFEKYAAAVGDEGTKRLLYRLYVAKFVCAVAFFVLLAAIVLEFVCFDKLTDPAAIDAAWVVYGITMFAWAACGIAWCVLAIVFRRRIRALKNGG